MHHDGVADLRPDDGAQVACPLRRRLLRRVGVIGVLLVQGLLEFILIVKANTTGRQEIKEIHYLRKRQGAQHLPPSLPPSEQRRTGKVRHLSYST